MGGREWLETFTNWSMQAPKMELSPASSHSRIVVLVNVATLGR